MFAAAMILAAPAHALTFETRTYTDDNQFLQYTDPTKKVEQFQNDDAQKSAPGSTTFHFSVRPSNERFFDRGSQFRPAWGAQPFPDGR